MVSQRSRLRWRGLLKVYALQLGEEGWLGGSPSISSVRITWRLEFVFIERLPRNAMGKVQKHLSATDQ